MSILSAKQNVYTIAKDYKTVGFYHKKKPYILGFRNAHIARNIMYRMHPEPLFSLITNQPTLVEDEGHNVELLIDSEATLFIPKSEYNLFTLPEHNLYYVNRVNYEEFVMYPYTKNLGVILPYVLIDESEEEFIYRSHVIDPMDASYFLK